MRFPILTICALGWTSTASLWGESVEPAEPGIATEKVVVDQGGAASIGLRLISTGLEFTAVQMDVRLPDEILNVSVTLAPDLEESKTMIMGTLGVGVRRILIYGLNQDRLPDGVIAHLAVMLRTDAAAGLYSVEVNQALGSDGSGHAVSLKGGIGGVIMPGEGVTAPVVAAVANAASYARDAVAPGEIVIIGGGGLAEEEAQASGRRAVSTSLGGVRVLFDGIPAPLLYVSARQISAVVPYALEGRTRAYLEIESRGIRSARAPVPVVAAAPGIFTMDQSGAGQGSILNQDGTANGAANPASRGSIAMIFGTGEGQTEPGGVDGMLVSWPDVRRTVLPVSVSVGGMEAEVLYAGSAPGQVAGLFQINARIPETAASGPLPITVKVGNRSSQAGVTVEVK